MSSWQDSKAQGQILIVIGQCIKDLFHAYIPSKEVTPFEDERVLVKIVDVSMMEVEEELYIIDFANQQVKKMGIVAQDHLRWRQ